MATFSLRLHSAFTGKAAPGLTQPQFQKRVLAYVLHPHKWKQYSHSFPF